MTVHWVHDAVVAADCSLERQVENLKATTEFHAQLVQTTQGSRPLRGAPSNTQEPFAVDADVGD